MVPKLNQMALSFENGILFSRIGFNGFFKEPAHEQRIN
jgi:hypothetical protein